MYRPLLFAAFWQLFLFNILTIGSDKAIMRREVVHDAKSNWRTNKGSA